MGECGRECVREAVASELEAIRAFYRGQGYGGGADPDDRIVVAAVGGDIVGVVRLVNESGVQVLRGMHIEKQRRRRGLGTEMLLVLEALIPAGERCWCLPFSHLCGFYGRVGFRQASVGAAPDFLQDRFAASQQKWGNIVVMQRPPEPPRTGSS